MAVVEGMRFMLFDPQEAMERHLKEHEELAAGKNGQSLRRASGWA